MKNNNSTLGNKGLGFFEKYLTIWVVLCIIAGILVGKYIPSIPETLNYIRYCIWMGKGMEIAP